MEKMSDSFCKLTIENKSPKSFKPSSDLKTQKYFYIISRVCVEKVKIGPCMSFLRRVWKLNDPYHIQYRKENRFLFSFESEKDRERVYNGGPWNFESSLIVMNRFDGKTQIDDLEINKQEFWIQIHGLPPHYLTYYFANQITDMVGNVTVTDVPKDGISQYPFLRCRRWIDVNEPLDRFGDFQTSDGKYHNVHFFYEQLPRFCYVCGKLNHGRSNCPDWATVDGSGVLPFGNWLRTPSPNQKKKTGKNKAQASSKWFRGESSNNYRRSYTNNPEDLHRNSRKSSELALVPVEDDRSSVQGSSSPLKNTLTTIISVPGKGKQKKEFGKRDSDIAYSAEKGRTVSTSFKEKEKMIALASPKMKDKAVASSKSIASPKAIAIDTYGRTTFADSANNKGNITKDIMPGQYNDNDSLSCLNVKQNAMTVDVLGEKSQTSMRPFRRLKSKIVIEPVAQSVPVLFLTGSQNSQKRMDDISEDRSTKRSRTEVSMEGVVSQSNEQAREAIEPPCQE